jgi:acylphosphatase
MAIPFDKRYYCLLNEHNPYRIRMNCSMAHKCIKALVSGRVQGVFFRDSTRKQALPLAITGHAINLADGRVEVIACGDEAQIDRLAEWLNVGPEHASVNSVEIEDIPIQDFSAFSTG